MKQEGWRALAKRAVDSTVAACGLLATGPLMAGTAVAVRLTMGAPVLFRQTRPGLNGRAFEVLKFRTMSNARRPDGTLRSDAERLTAVGRFLRRTSIDELPQLWNVLRGDLSLVGPRPLLMQYLERYSPRHARRHEVKPGITGWAQIRQGYANSIDDSRVKLEYDFYYILKQSPLLDIKVVFNTVGVLLTGGTEGKKRERTLAQAGEVQRTRLSLRRPFSALRLPRRASNSAALPSPREVSRRV